jgi:ATP-dependent Clp protease ATP-binding subunit ClpB
MTCFCFYDSYDPVYGARPLKRVIQRTILNPLSHKLIEGTLTEGDKVVVVKKGDGIDFELVKRGAKHFIEETE